MYKIYADNILIYDDTSSDPYLKVGSPALTLEDNSAGSLKITIPPGNAGYDTINLMTTNISVVKDEKEIWFGRVLQEDKDFWNQRTLLCEGALAFLNDTTQEQETVSYSSDASARLFLAHLLDVHNACMEISGQDDRKIELGAVTVYIDSLSCELNSEKTIECIRKFLLEQYGGHISITKSNGKLYLNYLSENVALNTQTIEFGKNLMDFTKSFDFSEIATVIVPLGGKIEQEEGYDGPDVYLTLEGYNRGGQAYPVNNTRYVVDSDLVEKYGWIEKVVKFDEIKDQQGLYLEALEYLKSLQFATMQLNLSAFDLHYLNPLIEDVKVGDNIRILSVPHGLTGEHGEGIQLPVTKLDIPLDQPQNTMFQLGDTIKTSLTSASNRYNMEMRQLIQEVVDGDVILEAARQNAAAIMNLHTNGYITITTGEYGTNELYVSETPDYRDATHYWRWNMNGLGYTNDGGQSWQSAILMDGSILGERIAAGSIHGSRITAGTLSIVSTTDAHTGLSISLAPRGLAIDAFEHGAIASDGTNYNDQNYGRTRSKIYLTRGTKVSVTNFDFQVIRYSKNNDAEGDFEFDYGKRSSEFTVPLDAYYRLVLSKPGTQPTQITDTDLITMASSVNISGTSAVISAADLKIIGMVTFQSLKDDDGTTEINGANIMTGTVTAEKINAYGLTIKKRRTGDPDNPTKWTGDTTFEIKPDGSVYVDAQVELSEHSSIIFDGGTSRTIGDVVTTADGAAGSASAAAGSASQAATSASQAATSAQNAINAANAANTNANAAKGKASEAAVLAAKIANGTYQGATIDNVWYDATFINNKTIYSPLIYADEFIVKTDQNTGVGSDASGSIIFEANNNESTQLFEITYYLGDYYPVVIFDANTYLNGQQKYGAILFQSDVEFHRDVELAQNNKLKIQGNTELYDGSKIMLNGGQIIAYAYINNDSRNSFGTANQRPSSPVVGQLYFQID